MMKAHSAEKQLKKSLILREKRLDYLGRKSIEGKPNTGNTPLILAVADFIDPTAFGDECSYLFCGCKSGSNYDDLCASVYDYCVFAAVL